MVARRMDFKVGQKSTYSRTFTEEDVKLFGELSGDKGIHHMKPDRLGRIMVQGLLTATIPTKMGGDMNYIARDMLVHFVKPVYVGDKVKCDAELVKVEEDTGFLRLKITMNCFNDTGVEVLTGETNGVIKKAMI
ncbi:MAG: enoyl-CoA hydratase [Candidatus Thermoplasmatota archaeon]|jgi:acyl dehydratase|nr:enoyl-CoA hydratase [Candidatus Thermoplasmatota archaeon]